MILTPLKNEKGIALLMVLSAVALMTTIMLSFSLDTSINKIKTYNLEDKAQAKLTAESGIHFAMARLKLYKEAYNYIIGNKGVSDIAKPEIVNSIWNFPFIYPLPSLPTMNQIQKDAVEKFQKQSLLAGKMRVTISNLSNKLNLNALRVALLNQAIADDQNAGLDPDDQPDQADENYSIKSQLIQSLEKRFERKNLDDDDFRLKYGNFEATDLVDVINLYISDKESIQEPGNAQRHFNSMDMTPKYSSFASLSELYSLPLWDDEIVELIKNEFTVHGAIMVDLNKITDQLLRILIPNITDDEVTEFFEYKNNPEDPKYFNQLADFKNYIVSNAGLMESDQFDEMIAEFGRNNVKFGPSPSLFKIISVGEKEGATYTLEAYVTMPPKPSYIEDPDDENSLDPGDTQDPEQPEDPDNPNDSDNTNDANGNDDDDKEEKKVFLLNPRIVEIYAK